MSRRLMSIVLGALLVGLLAAPTLSEPPARSSIRKERFRGLVLPSRRVELMAPLEEVLQGIVVSEGDRVTKGQLLARLDDRLQAVVVEAAQLRVESRAELLLASADLEEANDTLASISSAFKQGAASDVEFRRAGTLAARAEAAQLRVLETQALNKVNLKLEQLRLERHRITAPFDGLIVRVVAETGSLLTSQDPILVLADHDTLEARLDLPAEMYGQLEIGRTYTLAAEKPVNRELHATPQSFDPLIDNASGTFRCRFTIPNEGARLPAGFTVYLVWPPTPVDVTTVQAPTDQSQP